MSDPQSGSATNPLALQSRRALLASALLGAAALAAWRLTPTQRLATLHGELDLESSIPKAFGDWQTDDTVGGVVNPQQEELLKQLYSQILTRSYVNRATGERVMLSIAYGNDQRDGLQLHYPGVCYPAQGFQLLSNQKVDLRLAGASIPARRLETAFGRQLRYGKSTVDQ
jgi:hypothetical protein